MLRDGFRDPSPPFLGTHVIWSVESLCSWVYHRDSIRHGVRCLKSLGGKSSFRRYFMRRSRLIRIGLVFAHARLNDVFGGNVGYKGIYFSARGGLILWPACHLSTGPQVGHSTWVFIRCRFWVFRRGAVTSSLYSPSSDIR